MELPTNNLLMCASEFEIGVPANAANLLTLFSKFAASHKAAASRKVFEGKEFQQKIMGEL